jgi:hypothetical protein
MAKDVINVILQFRATHFQLLDFLVGREIDFLLDAINFIIEPVVFVIKMTEVIVGTFEAFNRFAMFRKFAKDGMMQVHGFSSPFFLNVRYERSGLRMHGIARNGAPRP